MPTWTARFPRNSCRPLPAALLAFLLVLSACRSARPSAPSAAATPSDARAWTDSAFVSWNTLALKGQFTYSDGSIYQKASYRLHMQRGERVWISINVLGIEGLRALITPDSVWAINRLEKTTIRAPYDTVATWLGYAPPLADFQRLLLGMLPAGMSCRDSSDRLRLNCTAGGDLAARFLLTPGEPRVAEARLAAPKQGSDLRLQHRQFQTFQNRLQLPVLTLLADEGQSPFNLRLEHRSVQVDPPDLSFSFRIPDAYD